MRWVFLVATVLGLFSTAQAYRLTMLNPRGKAEAIEIMPLLVLNLTLWYVPAALTIPVFRLASRFRFDAGRWVPALLAHAAAAMGFSVVHFLAMLATRVMLWPEMRGMPAARWVSYIQSEYLRNLDWSLVTYAAVLGLSYALGYYREARAREIRAAHLETSLLEARLKSLEAQLHPHFLFNTLHAISTLVHRDPESADRMISRLSDLLRLTFDRSGAPSIPLKEELEFLEKYLEIEQVRFQDRLEVSFDIDPATLDVEVPRLILQPLAENAIKHGLAPRTGAGRVQISATRTADGVWLEVRDNGVGLTAHTRTGLASGVGLSNTRDRLECLYGRKHRLEFAEDTGGLAVRVLIPAERPPLLAADASRQVATV